MYLFCLGDNKESRIKVELSDICIPIEIVLSQRHTGLKTNISAPFENCNNRPTASECYNAKSYAVYFYSGHYLSLSNVHKCSGDL